MNTKIYKIQMLRWHGATTRGEVRRSKPHVKTNCELASSHSEERGMKEGERWKKRQKRGERKR